MKTLSEALFSRKNINVSNHQLYGKSMKEAIHEFRADKDTYTDDDFCTILTTNDERKNDESSIYIFIYLPDVEEVDAFWDSIMKNTKYDIDLGELYDNVNDNGGYGIITFFPDSGAMCINVNERGFFLDHDIIKEDEVINKISVKKRYYTDICKYINEKSKELGIC